MCATCVAAVRRQERKKAAVDLMGGKCQVCGYAKCVGALDFHHVDPAAKSFSLSAGNRGWNAIKSELSKCVLLCCRCHREVELGVLKCPPVSTLLA